ncbi:MAG: hypothetical protein HC859_00010 [Bacteroidia bacterium]|nr:hypothetical protein [Bacteroidia bacterium]
MKRFWVDSTIATVFVFVMMWGVYKISQFDVFNAFDPLGKAFADMEITDLTFSYFRLEVHRGYNGYHREHRKPARAAIAQQSE